MCQQDRRQVSDREGRRRTLSPHGLRLWHLAKPGLKQALHRTDGLMQRMAMLLQQPDMAAAARAATPFGAPVQGQAISSLTSSPIAAPTAPAWTRAVGTGAAEIYAATALDSHVRDAPAWRGRDRQEQLGTAMG
eukprot:9454622-Pyramimonas_sp.AAC.4